MRADEVAAVCSDSGDVGIPGVQRSQGMRLVHEQVTSVDKQSSDVFSPGRDVGHPDDGTFAGVDQIGTSGAKRCWR